MAVHFPEKSVDSTENRRLSQRWIAGIALIVIGVAMLVATIMQAPVVDHLFLIAVGLVFIAWGIAVRSAGLFVPGGIVLGLGVGTLLIGDVFTHLSGGAAGGILMVSLGVGFMIITPLAMIFTSNTCTWALIPGGILALIGILLLFNAVSLDTLDVLSRGWPVILIAIGFYLIWHVSHRRSRHPSAEA